MKFSDQAKIINQMTTKQITIQLIMTQLILLLLAIVSSAFLFESFREDWKELFESTWGYWFLYGILPALIILFIDYILMKYLPKKYYDDGGINQKVFQNQSFLNIIALTLLVAVSEEMLFRGVVQKEFGYLFASGLFALLHFRYLVKPILLLSVIFVSFFIGYLFWETGSLMVTITTHFLVDAVLALWIRYGK